MAILGKIREKSIVLILVIGMALFAFVISGVFDGAMTTTQEPVAIVGDEKVNIEQFSRRVDAVERNTGMSNVWRTCGFFAAILTLFLDMGKAFLSLWICHFFFDVSTLMYLAR